MAPYSMRNSRQHSRFGAEHNMRSTDKETCNRARLAPLWLSLLVLAQAVGFRSTSIKDPLNTVVGALNDAREHLPREEEMEDLHRLHCRSVSVMSSTMHGVCEPAGCGDIRVVSPSALPSLWVSSKRILATSSPGVTSHTKLGTSSWSSPRSLSSSATSCARELTNAAPPDMARERERV